MAFGCGSEDRIVVFPFEDFIEGLPSLNRTELEERFYWHVHLSRVGNEFTLDTRREFENIIVTKYVI